MIQTKETVLILSPGFPANEEDNTCLPAQQLFVKALKKNFPFLKIIIIAFQYPFFSSDYKWNDTEVTSFGGKNKPMLQRFFLWKRIWKRMEKIKNENKIIGILSFWCGECCLLGKKFADKNDFKHYCWILGQDARKQNKYVKRIKPDAEELIAMSDFLANEFYKNFQINPKYIIPNAVDEKIFSGSDSKERDIDILGVGSLIPLKQYDIFLSVVNEIKKIFPFIKVILCGEGPEEKKLKLLNEKSGSQENILLIGKKQHSEVLKLMQQTKLFLHTSSYEGFSTVCLEALAAGAHVVSFCKPMNENINHWHIVKTKEEMIKKAIEILQNKKIELHPVIPYSIDETAKIFMKLMNN